MNQMEAMVVLLVGIIITSVILAWKDIVKLYDNPMDDLGGKDKDDES